MLLFNVLLGDLADDEGPADASNTSQRSESIAVGPSGQQEQQQQQQQQQQEWHEALALLAATAAPQLASYTPDTLTKLLWAVAHGGGRPPDAAWVKQAAEAVLGCCHKMTARQALRAVESFAALGSKVAFR